MERRGRPRLASSLPLHSSNQTPDRNTTARRPSRADSNYNSVVGLVGTSRRSLCPFDFARRRDAQHSFLAGRNWRDDGRIPGARPPTAVIESMVQPNDIDGNAERCGIGRVRSTHRRARGDLLGARPRCPSGHRRGAGASEPGIRWRLPGDRMSHLQQGRRRAPRCVGRADGLCSSPTNHWSGFGGAY